MSVILLHLGIFLAIALGVALVSLGRTLFLIILGHIRRRRRKITFGDLDARVITTHFQMLGRSIPATVFSDFDTEDILSI